MRQPRFFYFRASARTFPPRLIRAAAGVAAQADTLQKPGGYAGRHHRSNTLYGTAAGFFSPRRNEGTDGSHDRSPPNPDCQPTIRKPWRAPATVPGRVGLRHP